MKNLSAVVIAASLALFGLSAVAADKASVKVEHAVQNTASATAAKPAKPAHKAAAHKKAVGTAAASAAQ